MTDALTIAPDAEITGGARPALTREDRELLDHIYGRLMVVVEHLAHKGKQLELQCATRTYAAHLDFDELAAGPWLWDIKDSIPYGDVYLYSRAPGSPERQREGQLSISSLVLPH